ncbi:MAG: agmatine deiminase family protein, partial [Planctomycetaceae bacterium]|nr:agmatine deiminase family protein [Planctomycetaceae bacterium]
MTPPSTPKAAGFYMPAEWEPHAATWLGWPHNADDWPDKLPAIHWAYGEIVRHLAPGEVVRLLVNSAEQEELAQSVLSRVGVDSSQVEFFRHPTNRGWTRDFGPIFVRSDDRTKLAIARFRFNAWAKYPDWELDDRIPELLANDLGLEAIPIQHVGRDIVLEGGAIEVNGSGTVLTTEECLLDQEVQTRNPGLSREDMESVLCGSFGV